MRTVKGLLVAFAGLALVVTILSLFIPSRVVTIRSVVVNAPEEKIRLAIHDLANWKAWNPVFSSNATVQVSSPSTGPGAHATWTSQEKLNTLTIDSSNAGGIQFRLSREGENAIQNNLSILSLTNEPGLQVEWRALTTLKWYPWEKFAGMFVDEMSGQAYQQSLDSLKRYVESLP